MQQSNLVLWARARSIRWRRQKKLLYEATKTWEGAVSVYTHDSVHASCSPSPRIFSTSLFAIAIIA